jgi:hypothetical protein
MAGNVICSKCGQANEADQTFCASCGAFLEWAGQRVEGDESSARPASPPATPPPAVPVDTRPSELAGLARPRPTEPNAPAADQPPPVSPVRPGPSIRSVPAGPADSPGPIGSLASPARIAPPDPTIACPSCGRANPLDRTFCHSCGALLRPKPAEPAARRRGAGSGIYRPLSILLLIAIILLGSFLLTRLTVHSGGPGPTPSAVIGWSVAG